ncbi:MAG TPA: 16S rRNA (adenine(1518)-N(6)/adenine(1519)-N(6))-dimethyltransferase RsmA [Dehalococcoidia bacterium]|nr:16S rRNA (adenine(1518)-N(6)/adenine(1519)-N(6))-dimethyltransferase RsmA [Dehalococcoidia bacterium]
MWPSELRRLGLRPRKGLGQHFLLDRRYLSRIVAAADLSSEDTVVEVGAGHGLLTEALASRSGRVIAVEVDPDLCAYLRSRLAHLDNVAVVEGDILTIPQKDILGGAERYLLLGNLPFNIATAVVRRFLEAAPPPQRLVVTVQREVAGSMAAAPGKMGLLSVAVQFYGQPKIMLTIPPRAFYPPPKVTAALVRIDVRPRPAVEVDDREGFFQVVRAGFAAPRKQLRNALALGLRVTPLEAEALLRTAGLDPTSRAQELTLEQWAQLYRAWR